MKLRRWLSGVGVVLCLLVGLLLPVSLVSALAVTVSIDAPATVAPGGNFTAQVDISNVENFDSSNFEVVFDPAVLEITDPSPGVGVTDGQIGGTNIPVVSTNELSAGRIRVVINVPGTPGVTGSGYLCELHFHAIGSEGTSSDINLENGLLGDNTANEIPAAWVGATVDIGVPVTLEADAGGPYSGTAGESVSLSGSAAGGTPPYSYAWDLDDDGDYDDSTAQNPSSIWATAGNYTVGLEVTDDDDNTDTDAANVSISAAVPPSEPDSAVGGIAYLPDKPALLAPWIALGAGIIILVAVVAWLVVRRRRVY